MCISLAGYIIGFIAARATITFVEKESLANLGGLLGLGFGAGVGGVVGFLGWAITGIIAPPTRTLLPSDSLVRSTMGAMVLATLLGVISYLAWCFIFGFIHNGFFAEISGNLLFAMFGVPAIMGVGQIIGIWRGVIKTRQEKQSVPPVSIQNN